MNDLWGQISPPRWQSNLETSLLNKEEGRAAAASFNTAWNSSFGREQDENVKRKSQQMERDRIKKESDAIEKAKWNSLADRKQKEFKDTLAPFVMSLSPANQPPSTTSYGSPGGPSNGTAPWAVGGEGSLKTQSPNESLWNKDLFSGGVFGGGVQNSFHTGESGPFDPTYEDYQRAKSEHPALWLDPVTAPTMQKMDQSWNEMEKTRMLAEVNKDKHQAFQAKQEADQLALDVGKQGMTRFGLRENAYLKAPSEIQMKIDAMPNRGRYPDDSGISKSLRFSPLTAAAENELNQYLANQNQLRIDGANKDELDQRKIEAMRAAHPGGKEKLTLGPKGTTVSIESPKPGEDPDVEPKTKVIGGVTVAWMPGSKGLHIIKGDKSTELTAAQALKLSKETEGDDASFFNEYAIAKGREQTRGFKPSEKPKQDRKSDGFWDRVKNIFSPTPKTEQSPNAQAPEGWVMTPGGEWMRPDTSQSQNVPEPGPAPTVTNAAPSTAPTNAAPKIPKVQSQADIDKAIDLANKAIQRGANANDVKKRLAEMGINLKQ